MSARAHTVVKSRYYQRGSGRTAPAAYRGTRGLGARRSIGRALRYIETRSLGEQERSEDRALFDREHEAIGRSVARDALAERASTRLAYHSLVLSPGPGAERLGTQEMQEWTRQVMRDLERRLERELSWYAVVHRHTAHPHVHVLVGASALRDDGRGAELRLSREDFRAMRESGDREHTQLRLDEELRQQAEQYAARVTRDLRSEPTHSSGGGGWGGAPDHTDDGPVAARTRDDEQDRER